jgi:hypothetical protein
MILCATFGLRLGALLRVRILDALLHISFLREQKLLALQGTNVQALLGMDISVDSSSTTPIDHQRNHQLCKKE